MAGELPGAGDARKKKQNNRKPLRWQDDKSTDKIYKSKDISALDSSRTVADSTLKPGQEPKGIPTPTMRHDDKSSDKYYAEGGSQRPRAGAQAGKKLGPAPVLGVKSAKQLPAKKGPPRTRTLNKVNEKDDIPVVLDSVVSRLAGGETGLVVYVKTGDSALLRRTRAALDLLVTRETITEDQYREVRLSYDLAPGEQAAVAAKLSVPTAKETVRTEENESTGVDPLAFLSGEAGADPEDPVVDTSPIKTVQEIDTTGDTTTEVNDADDDDGDFLAPKPTEPADDRVFTPDAAEVNLEPPAHVTEAAPKKRSRRSGRGAD